MNALSVSVGENLQRLQAGFKRELLKEVKAFRRRRRRVPFGLGRERSDGAGREPAGSGGAAEEVHADVRGAQTQVAQRVLLDGEELFGLTVTQYPETGEDGEGDSSFSGRLYDLYTNVIATIDGYADILWTEVVANIDQMNEQVSHLPGAVPQAAQGAARLGRVHGLRKKIDDFLEILPMVQALASSPDDARPRHWQALMALVGARAGHGRGLVQAAATCSDANLLPHVDEIEELTGGARQGGAGGDALEQIERGLGGPELRLQRVQE
jgi:dynein heavy chain